MLRKNTASQGIGFGLVTTAGAAATGATVTVYRVIDGGAQASATGTVTEKGNGQYWFAASQADTNGNQISYLFTASGCVPVEKTIVTTAADPTDTVRFGLTALPNAAAAASGGLLTYGTSTGQLNPSSGKIPATLASTDVTGNVAADVQTIKTQTVTCAAGVTVGAYVGNATAALSVDASGRVDVGKLLGTASQGTAGHVAIDLLQTGLSPRALDAVADASLRVGDALVSAIAAAAGKETVVGTAYTVKTPSTGTVIRTFTLDSATSPTSRS